LYAWALFEDLRVRFPRRRIVLVMHNSGVTKRDQELSNFFDSGEISVIGDYKPKTQNENGGPSRFRVECLVVLKKFLHILGLIASANSDNECSKIRPWVLSLRGHYTKRLISNTSIQKILDSLESTPIAVGGHSDGPIIGLHFRLGDLLALDSKTPLAVSRITRGLNLGNLLEEFSVCLVFSDSPKEAESLLRVSFPLVQFVYRQASPQTTILELLQVHTFVGTPSKISEWVALIRIHTSSSPNVFLPSEMKRQMGTTLGNDSKIIYY